MQATIELTKEEYEALENHVKKIAMMDSIGFSRPSTCDKILGRLYLTLVKMQVQEGKMER